MVKNLESRKPLLSLTSAYAAIIAAMSVVWLGGCEPSIPALSLEDAKKVTATIQGQTFVAPPRTVKDLLTELDALSASNDKLLADFRAKATAPAPASASKSAQSRHFAFRAEAARNLGLYSEALDDAQMALDLATGDEERRTALYTLSAAHEELGNYRKALEAYEKRAAMASRASHYLDDYPRLTTHYSLVGDLSSAEKALGNAKSRLPELNGWTRGRQWIPFYEAFVDLAEGDLRVKQGDYPKAEKALQQGIRVMNKDIASGGYNDDLSTLGSTLQHIRYRVRTYMSRLLSLAVLRQGRLVEAEVIAREAVLTQARIFGRYSGQTQEGLQALSEIVTEQGRFEDAEDLIRASLDIYDRIGAKRDSTTRGITRRTLADAYVGRHRWQQAQEVYNSLSRDLAERPDDLAGIFDANLNWAISLIRLNRGTEAVKRLEKTYSRLLRSLGESHYDTAEARGMLASALAAGGDTRPALDAFSKAVPTLLSRDSLSEGEGTSQSGRIMRQRFIFESYMNVLTTLAASGGKLAVGTAPADEAFRIADAARGGSVNQALSSSAARAAIADLELAALARREQNALQEIGALNGILRNAGGEDSKVVEALTVRISTLKSARSALMQEIIRKFPGYADLIDPKPGAIAEVRNSLGAGEALIAIYSTEQRTYVWAVPARGEVAFAAVPVKRTELEVLGDRVRKSTTLTGKTLGDIPAFDVVAAQKLYELLLKPVEKGWKSSKNLVVVSDGPLGHLPFSLLLTGPAKLETDRAGLFSNYRGLPWLARTHAVSTVPSVSALMALRQPSAAPVVRQAFAGFGDPWFNAAQAAEGTAAPIQVASRGVVLRNTRQSGVGDLDSRSVTSVRLGNLARLPETRDEVLGIARAMKADEKQDVFLGREASEEKVKTLNLSDRRVIAFATHGLVAGDLDGLAQPALALSAPEVTGGKEDGLLTMTEILGLKLNADWVVLSACNTAAADGKGAEAVSGLGRAFFYAGARALLATHWAVETTSATALTTELFRRQAANDNLPRAEALRQSMLALIDGPGMIQDGKTVATYAHPLFWAPFALVGDGGGGVR